MWWRWRHLHTRVQVHADDRGNLHHAHSHSSIRRDIRAQAKRESLVDSTIVVIVVDVVLGSATRVVRRSVRLVILACAVRRLEHAIVVTREKRRVGSGRIGGWLSVTVGRSGWGGKRVGGGNGLLGPGLSIADVSVAGWVEVGREHVVREQVDGLRL